MINISRSKFVLNQKNNLCTQYLFDDSQFSITVGHSVPMEKINFFGKRFSSPVGYRILFIVLLSNGERASVFNSLLIRCSLARDVTHSSSCGGVT